MNIKLAQIDTITPGDSNSTGQSSSQSQSVLQPAAPDNRPESSRGKRVILDEQVQATPNFDEPRSIPTTTYYWLGAIGLIIVAFVVAASMYHRSKTEKFGDAPAGDDLFPPNPKDNTPQK